MPEPHSGFKVFVVNDDGHGKAFMITVHQGTSGAGRATTQFHTVDLVVTDLSGRRLLARTSSMADFGELARNCSGTEPSSASRLVPVSGVGCESTYESWVANLSLGGKLRAPGIGFSVLNPVTSLNGAGDGVVVNDQCQPPGTTSSRCAGDIRVLEHPRWQIRNRGPSVFYTDAHGKMASARPFPGAVRQFVRRGLRVDERRFCCGPANEYRMADPGDGGVYRPGERRRARGFDTTQSLGAPN
jgi:hypothetical protein